MTPLSRKKLYIRSCKLQYLIKELLIRRVNKGETINTFAGMESDCTLRFGFKALMKSILCTKQANLFLHFLSTLKRFSRS